MYSLQMHKTHHLRSLTDSWLAHLVFLAQTPTFTFSDSDPLNCIVTQLCSSTCHNPIILFLLFCSCINSLFIILFYFIFFIFYFYTNRPSVCEITGCKHYPISSLCVANHQFKVLCVCISGHAPLTHCMHITFSPFFFFSITAWEMYCLRNVHLHLLDSFLSTSSVHTFFFSIFHTRY